MLQLNSSIKIYMYPYAVDMRLGFDRLAFLCKSELNLDPYSGLLFLFFNRRKDRVKIFFYEDGGCWLFYRRFDQGTFKPPQISMRAKQAVSNGDDFKLLLNSE